jgi:hypothetical protein
MIQFAIAIILFCSPAFAVQVHTHHGQMDSIRPVQEPYVPEYQGQKDRYDEAKLRNDPEVLISSVPKQTGVTIPEAKVALPVASSNDGILVSSCIEYNGQCNSSKYFSTTVGE